MKNLIALFTLTFVSSNLYAVGSVPDRASTGSIILNIISTTTADANKSYGTKLNDNSQIISTKFSGVDASISVLNTSTGQARIDIAASTNALATGISASTNAFASAVAVDTTTLANKFPAPKSYALIVGTYGAIGVDVYVDSISNFNLMLASVSANGLTTSSTASAKIFFKSGNYFIQDATVPAGIWLVGDSSTVWINPNSTRTAVTVYGTMEGFKFDLANTSYTSKYITLKSNSRFIDFKIYNNLFGHTPSGGGDYSYTTIGIGNVGGVPVSSNIVIRGEFENVKFITSPSEYGDSAPIIIFDSIDTDIQLIVRDSTMGVTSSVNSTAVFMTLARNTNIRIHDSRFYDIGGNFIVVDGNSGFYYERNYHKVSQKNGDEGLMLFQAQASNGVGNSTPIVVADNYWEFSNPQAVNGILRVIRIGSNGGGPGVDGLQVRNNIATTLLGVRTNYVFFSAIANNCRNAIVTDNTVFGLASFEHAANKGSSTNFTRNLFNGNYITDNIFYTSATAMTVTGGNVSIGTNTNSGVTLEIAGSITVRSFPRTSNSGQSGGISFATATVNGNSLFGSTFSAFAMDGTVIRVTTGSVAANTSITITAANIGLSSIRWVMCSEVENTNTAGTSVRPKALDALPASFQVFNADALNIKDFSCITIGKP